MNREYVIKSLERNAAISIEERGAVITWVRQSYPNYISTIKHKLVSATFKEVLEHIKNNLPEVNMSKYYIIPFLSDHLVFETSKDAEEHILDNLQKYSIDEVDNLEEVFYDNIEQVVFDELSSEQKEYLLDND